MFDGQCEAVRIVDHPDLLLYDFGPQHPLRPERITAGLDLLRTAGLWHPETETLQAEAAAVPDLERVHSSAYVRAVDEAGTGYMPGGELIRYGFGSMDNPPFPDMHYAAALVAGAAAVAVRQIMDGSVVHAFSPAGGLHHALRARDSGFRTYNDPAIACAIACEEYRARVLYIDLDCHHGDGVQWIFYDEPAVMTVSFHESGRFLFPGTGDVTETGEAAGRGFSVNVPFGPFTRDRDWFDALDTLVPVIVERFRPDIVISNHGCDTHVWDPLTHLSLTTSSFVRQVGMVHQLAHRYCGGRWLAVGSGGYDWRRVVPRSWAIVWAEMSGRPLPEALPAEWCERWLAGAEFPLPERFLDDEAISPPYPREPEIRQMNADSIRAAAALLPAVT